MTKREHLSFEEQIIVAYAHYVRGVEQQTLAAIFCTNNGRISEACTAIKDALNPVTNNGRVNEVWREQIKGNQNVPLA